ncbi:MAG: hypothetical protein Q9190_007050 [Brigantiaea leucoxantha]
MRHMHSICSNLLLLLLAPLASTLPSPALGNIDLAGILPPHLEIANSTSLQVTANRAECFTIKSIYKPTTITACAFALIKLLNQPNAMEIETWRQSRVLERTPCEIYLVEIGKGVVDDFSIAEIGVKAANVISQCVLDKPRLSDRRGGYAPIGRRGFFNVVVVNREQDPGDGSESENVD